MAKLIWEPAWVTKWRELERLVNEPKKCPGCQRRTLGQHRIFRSTLYCLNCGRLYKLVEEKLGEKPEEPGRRKHSHRRG